MNETRPNSPLTLEQWQSLEIRLKVLHQAMDEALVQLALLGVNSTDPETQKQLTSQAVKIADAKHTILTPYHYHPQPEWLGGSDTGNWVYREPHLMGLRRWTVESDKKQ